MIIVKKIFKRVSAAVMALAVAATAVVFDVSEVKADDFNGATPMENVHMHKVCAGLDNCPDPNHASHEVINDWQPISSASSFSSLTDGGHYYLNNSDGSIKLSSEVTITNNITLCLNGQTLTAADNNRIFKVDGGSLTLCDCKGGGKLTGGNPTVTRTDGGAVMVSSGTFTMYGGTITKNNSSQFGGGVRVTSQSTFIMYGGTISDNTTEQDSGGGVSVYGGKFTMNGGTISNNTTANNGGGVHVDSSSTSDFIMNGGTISGNTAKSGGGVYAYGKFTMNGGIISSNKTTTNSGGGVHAYNDFTMNGGTISNNTAAGNGGGVCLVSYSSFNFVMNGGTISGNTAGTNGGGVYGSKGMTLNGGVTITGNTSGTVDAKKDDNVYLDTNKTLTIGSDFSTTSSIGITTKAVPTCQAPVDITTTDNVTENTVNSFKADKEGQQIVFADGKLQFKGTHTYDASTGVCTACGNAGKLGNNATWTYDETSNTLTISGTGTMPYNTAGDTPWNSMLTDIKKVVIEDGITSIGANAFNGCSNLASVIISEDVTTIGTSAFEGCESLANITLPEGMNTIGTSAFEDCTNLTSITIPGSVTTMGISAFAGCTSLENVTISSGVTSTGEGSAFVGCTSLKNVTIPDTVTKISPNTFANCTSLTEINIPDNVTEIGFNAFDNTGLTEVTIPGGVTKIGNEAFKNCNDLKTVTFKRATPPVMGSDVFNGCTALDEIAVPEGSKDDYKGNSGFTGLTDKVSDGTPDNKCGDNATWEYDDTTKTLTISGTGDMTDWTLLGSDVPWADKAADIEKVVINSGITSIGDLAFRGCTGLTSVTIPDGVTSIGMGAFNGCTSLDTIVYPSGATVEENTIPATATQIKYAVENGKRNVTEITLGSGKTSVTVTDAMGISSVAEGQRSKLSQTGHTHTGGTATCAQKAKCDVCNAEHGDLAAHTLTHVDETPATATTTGVKAHWHCDDCDKNFADKNGTTEMTNTDLTIPVIGHTHTLIRVPEVPATATAAGVKEHWHCDGCGKNFADENGETEMTDTDLAIPVIGHKHTLVYVPEVPATADAAGIKGHWHCDGCGKNFADKDGTKEVTADDLKTGKIETEVQSPVNVEIAISQEELIAAALTEDEQKKAKEGTDIKIILKVEDAAENISADDKGKVETAIGSLNGYKLGQYLEVTLLKKIGGDREQKIIETNAPIEITFEIPENLRGKAEYSVIRVHNGTAAVLPDLDSDPDTVTIKTDKFSTYVLTYKEKAAASDPGDDPSGGNSDGSSDPSSTVPTESDNSDAASNAGNSSDGNSDTASNESDTNSNGGASSGAENNHAPSDSGPSEDNDNPSTGIAVSLIPLAAALAVVVITVNRRRK